MAEEQNFESESQSSQTSTDPAAWAALSAASREKVDAFLDEQKRLALEQTALVRLQAEELEHELKLRHWSLRVRHLSDVLKLTFEVALALTAIAVVALVGAAVWNATQDHDLVVDPFSVPPDIAQNGMTGTELATRVIDRVGEMQVETYSLAQGAESYRSNEGKQARIEIPSTDVSIGEIDLYLRQWLGHETEVTGSLVHTPKGLAVTIRYGGEPGNTVEGNDVKPLIDDAAERLYRAARPLRYADYLTTMKRYREAEALIVSLARRGSPQERALAYVSWGTLLWREGDSYGEMEKSAIATRLDPANAAAWYQLAAGAYNVQHRETAVKAEKAVLSLLQAGKAGDLDPDKAAVLPHVLAADLATDTGDASGAIAQCQRVIDTDDALDCSTSYMIGYQSAAHNLAETRRLAALLPASEKDGTPNADAPATRARIAAATEDWRAAVTLYKKALAIASTGSDQSGPLPREIEPRLAIALAQIGDFGQAEALIAATPVDCDGCVDARAQVAAAKHDWSTAQRWFALVSARAPSLPYFDSDWGRALLQKGDYDGAIAKFETAHAKGPHFADPLEMWGEALMQKNRSDLALPKFEEADKYAPNWGHLHLEWGEALFYAGKKDEAKKRFAIASGLDLSASDRAAAIEWTSAHG